MANNRPPEGEFFSRLYLERGAPVRDSARLRERLLAYLRQDVFLHQSWHRITAMASVELGVPFPTGGAAYDLPWLYNDGEIRDVLDTITVIYKVASTHGEATAQGWLEFVRRNLREENLGYSIDDKGGVHFFVDQEYECNRVSAIQSLKGPQFAGVLHALESAYARLDEEPPDTKSAIREAFEALETLCKQACQTSEGLDAGFVNKRLRPLVSRLYGASDAIARGAAEQMLESFRDWINAAHKYRHGHNEPGPVKPPIDLAVLMLSQGAAYIRWLVSVFLLT